MEEQKIIEKLKLEGCDKVYVWDAGSGEIDEEHQHDFETRLVILEGEIEIKITEGSKIYKSGDEVIIPKNQLHSAKVGQNGCRYIVAEKS